jgi:hypothetical protein
MMLVSFASADRDTAASIRCKFLENVKKVLHVQTEWYSHFQIVQKSMDSWRPTGQDTLRLSGQKKQSTQPSDSALLKEQKNSPMEDLEAYPVHDLEADHASDAHHQASAGTTS